MKNSLWGAFIVVAVLPGGAVLCVDAWSARLRREDEQIWRKWIGGGITLVEEDE